MVRAWFADKVVFDSEYLKKLRDLAGISAIIPDDYKVHQPGYKQSSSIAERSPFKKGWRNSDAARKDVEINGWGDGSIPVFAGLAAPVDDDSSFLRLLEECDRLGLEVWGHLGLWGNSGNVFPEYGFVDFSGGIIEGKDIIWGVPLCVNNKKVRDWVVESIVDMVVRYKLPALNVDHGHFPPLASLKGLLGCACAECRRSARKLGFDFNAMQNAVMEVKRHISELTCEKLDHFMGDSPSFIDLLSFLGGDTGLLEWFRFRTISVSTYMAYLTETVHSKVGRPCPVDSHIMPPSIAYLCGQDFKLWEKAVDRVSPGWGPIVGWDAAQINSFAVIAGWLIKSIKGLDEKTALSYVYKLFDYDGINMPDSISGLNAHHYSAFEVYKKEILLADTLSSGETGILYPYDVTMATSLDLDCMGELIASLKAEGFVCFNWGNKATDKQLEIIGRR